jgi:hypothetical protein
VEESGTNMWALTTYHYKGYMPKEDMARLLEVYGTFGTYPGVKYHFEFIDGSGGFFFAEVDDSFDFFKSFLPYEEFMTFDTKWVIPVEDAAKAAMEFVGV